jgi:hypothetical protein
MTMGSGIVVINLLLLWLLFRPSAAETTHGLQWRQTRRHSVLLPVDVDGNRGFTKNISLTGCRVKGNMAMRRGEAVMLQLHLPGEESPVIIERAAVRWVGGNDFGLQFLSLQSVERERLRGLLQWVA